MGRFLSAVVGIIGAVWLGIAGGGIVYWWDRRPHGVPSLETRVIIFPVKISAPDSLGARLAAALAAQKQSADELARCQDNERAALTAVDDQNAAVDAAKRASDARVARAEKAAQDAAGGRQRAEAAVARINAAQATGGSCFAAEKLIREEIR